MKKFKVYLQHDSMECGMTCLRMVCKHYGAEYSSEYLSRLCFATNEGVLTDDGTIKWDENKLRKRLEKPTFDNPRCLNCKILPLCLGPCSQKLMESGHICDNICSLKSIDISFEDYLKMEFEMRYILQKSE